MKLTSLPSFLLIAGTCVFTPLLAQIPTGEASTETITSGPPPKALPDQPGWGYWRDVPQAWLQTHNGFVANARKGGIDIVFLGDSITAGWKTALTENWAGTAKPLTVINFGIGGDTTRQLLWRIDHGTLDGLSPKLVVLMIGTNNLYGDHNSGTPEQIAQGVAQVIKRIQTKSPGTRILVLGVLPRETESWCMRVAKLNECIAKIASGKNLRYLDVGAAFLDGGHQANPELYQPDAVHLNAAGYEKLNAAVKPAIASLLK